MALQPDTEPVASSRFARSSRRGLWTGLDHSSMMGMELVAGILTWTGIGWLLDRWLGTAPWLLGIGAFVGFGGGLSLIWMRSARMEGGTPAPVEEGGSFDG